MGFHETAFFTNGSESKCLLPRWMNRIKFVRFYFELSPTISNKCYDYIVYMVRMQDGNGYKSFDIWLNYVPVIDLKNSGSAMEDQNTGMLNLEF